MKELLINLTKKVSGYWWEAVFILAVCLIPMWGSAQDIPLIKDRIVASLLEGEINAATVAGLLDSQRADGTWPGINYEDVSRTGFEHRLHSANLVLLSKAYTQHTSKFRRSKRVLQAIERGLSHWVEQDYFCDNWWHNQIGTPMNMVHVMLLVGSSLPSDLVEATQPIIGRAHLNASGARPSGDRIKIAGILAKNLLFVNNIAEFEEVIDVIEGEIKFAEGRGMQYDYSFHHREDRVNNTLSYGLGYADAFVEWAVYVAGTKYAFSEEKSRQLIDYYLDGIAKTMAFGKYPDTGAKNRSIARPGALKPMAADTPKKLLLTTNYRRQELEEVIATREKGIDQQTRSHSTFFWHSEHFTFQRPHYFTSVRMYSTRNANMEVPYNSEGLKNHHRGDGTNHLAVTGEEYADIFPVMDYQKIPGATILQKEELPDENQIQKWGSTEFVGAVTDGTYGMAAFDFKSAHDPLSAKKAWFFFDEGYVCLGAGIAARSGRQVTTTVNQNLLRGEVRVSHGTGDRVLASGSHELEGIQWVYTDSVGYVFPQQQQVRIANGPIGGKWTDISRQSSSPTELVTKNVFSLWLDHGFRPANGSYSYVVFPAVDRLQVAKWADSLPMEILSNTSDLQAVKHKISGLYQLVFYRAGELALEDGLTVKMDSPGLVMIQVTDGKVTQITGSDPTRRLAALHLRVSQSLSDSAGMAALDAPSGDTLVRLALPQGVFAGKSMVLELK
ncbi:polysaccharide lyase family 8 super-sandwich domain-containing protein [Lunatimonas salinarum]|uniref:polysaccharide lyase family 8 super-sandwich domain-containing protein n=1 Tax=Lunatimonas salinarum TaxID=1774590 RepID=UPI001FD7626A|nr:polysaccharide lyase family 8 super-sandwich domain-containing protein [Lunatimonas salinarum]